MQIIDLTHMPIWQHFYEITKIPRPSKHEEQTLAFLKKFAEEHNLDYVQDKTGNIVIRKGATPDMEDRETIILQGHIDMICEKNSGVEHDFYKDPIKTQIADGWIHAEGTTFGTDNGIGVAVELAALTDPTVEHGPVECLFTVDGETDLTGAMSIESGFVQGRVLINLDNEDEGEMFISYAGSMGTMAFLDYMTEVTPAGQIALEVKVDGFKGGHSGGDIHVGLGNANKLLMRYLYKVLKEVSEMHLVMIGGGNLHNAIAREAKAVVTILANRKENLAIWANEMDAEFRNELRKVDPNVDLRVETTTTPKEAVDAKAANTLIRTLYACPHGVMGMSHSPGGLVKTSTNLASVKMWEGNVTSIETSQRSSTESLKEGVGNMLLTLFELAGARTEVRDGYPGWAPNPNSETLKVAESTYRELFGKEPKAKAIHTGLECGFFPVEYPYLDMVSFGPMMHDVHSPTERMEVQTVEMFWRHLVTILKSAPERK